MRNDLQAWTHTPRGIGVDGEGGDNENETNESHLGDDPLSLFLFVEEEAFDVWDSKTGRNYKYS